MKEKYFLWAGFLGALVASFTIGSTVLMAQTPTPTPFRRLTTPTPTPVVTPEPLFTPKPDITQKTKETLGPLEQLLRDQKLGSIWPTNPMKYAIRSSVEAGIPANTIVLLLLLPVVAALIAAARHLIGLRGFGIFLPAALAVTFVATGPVIGLVLFLTIVLSSSFIRFTLRKTKIRLQYLPRMSFLLWGVVLGVMLLLFSAPLIGIPGFANVSIFPILVLVLLAEDFTKVQLGKSFKTALNVTMETLVLALVSYIFLTLEALQRFALLNPEILFVSVGIFNILLGRYIGLRFIEFWRFRKLISSE